MTPRRGRTRPSDGKIATALTTVVDVALKSDEVGMGHQATGYVVASGRDVWFVKVPNEVAKLSPERLHAEALRIDHEVAIGEGLRAAGFTAMVEPSWRASSSEGFPALVRPAGVPIDNRDLNVADFVRAEAFLTDIEDAGWRVNDGIQLVNGPRGVMFTDLEEWKRGRKTDKKSKLPFWLRHLAHDVFGTDEGSFLTLPEMRAHEAWLRAKLAKGPLDAGQIEAQREDWLPAVEEREAAGVSVPATFKALLERATRGAR